MMEQTSFAAWLFLPFVLPICIWAAWNDLRAMKIPNKAVIALALVFVLLGLFVMPWPDYLWRLAQLVVVLLVGIVLNATGAMGAGDAKFAAVRRVGDIRIFSGGTLRKQR